MMFKLIQKEGYIDEINTREILNQYQTNIENEKFNIIYKHILRHGFLTIEQIIQSTKDILKNQSSEYKTIIQEQFLINILDRKQLTNIQFELAALSQNMCRCQVIQTNILSGWKNDIYLEFKRELNIIDSDNSLDSIRHITYNILLLIKENDSITKKPLMKHFQQHQIIFHADFQLLLIRYGMTVLEDLMDLLIVSKLAKTGEIKSYAKTIFCLNIIINMLICYIYFSYKGDVLIGHWALIHLNKEAQQQNYIHLHPINTFNALNALQLEFDFNNYDMKFLRDLKLLSDIWYKRYLLSQTNETDRRVSEIIDHE
ncbi:unnamed protein product [Rotaria sp. Silwood1]|nr:unnamed protein product [Rotaria sp. Silwood1]